MEQLKRYDRDFKVLSPDSTQDKLLKPSVAMKYFQEMSDMHCRVVGNGYEELRDKDMAFISVRTSVTFHRTPKWGEVVHAGTWHRATKGTQWLRDCVLTDDNGEILVESTTGWVLMSLSERKICRPNKVEGVTVLHAPEFALENERLGRIKLPEDMPVVGHRKIEYSDIDYFGHLNNCVYADIICNAMPTPMKGRELKTLDIHFHNEAEEGDVLELRAKEVDGVTYFIGFHERGECFEATATSVEIV